MKKKLNSYFIKASIELNTVRIKSCLFLTKTYRRKLKKKILMVLLEFISLFNKVNLKLLFKRKLKW